MARIRTIKPEFPQSESMGRISRNARLLFIELWTICDDSGRTRAASRMLASLLFPYDDDAPSLIEEWLAELEQEKCILRYQFEGASYLQILNWLSHQKIDKPSQSKIPSFEEVSRILANPREVSSEDQGPRTKDQGPSNTPSNEGVPQTAADDPEKIRVPYAKIVESYKAILVPLGLPDVVRITDARKAHIRQRWLCELPTLDDWDNYWKTVAASAFLTGKARASPGKLPFVASLDWLITPSNLIKVLEGNYTDGARKQASEDRGRAGRFHDKLREYALEDAEGVGSGALCEVAGAVRN